LRALARLLSQGEVPICLLEWFSSLTTSSQSSETRLAQRPDSQITDDRNIDEWLAVEMEM